MMQPFPVILFCIMCLMNNIINVSVNMLQIKNPNFTFTTTVLLLDLRLAIIYYLENNFVPEGYD